MNIQNELNLELNGEALKLENHLEAEPKQEQPEFNLELDKTPANIYNPTPVPQNTLLSSEALANKQRYGPPGANLFIFHLPNDWTEVELTNCFKEFGNVISARIECDKETGRSKGYGFVS